MAWRARLDGVEPDFDAVPRDASLDQDARIVPDRLRNWGGVFYALEGIDPSDVDAIVIGNDPYPDPDRATGRSFEQGDLTEWIDDLAKPGRVTPSLLNLVCAAAALLPDAKGLGLDRDPSPRPPRKTSARAARRPGRSSAPPVHVRESDRARCALDQPHSDHKRVRHRQASSRELVASDRRTAKLASALWRPVTRAIVSSLVEDARQRPVVFVLFGGKARNLRGWIEAQGRRLSVPSANLRFVESGHPSVPRYFFCSGNPLERVNDELAAHGCEPIDWCGPTAGRMVTNDSTTRLSTTLRRTRGPAGPSTVRTVARFAAGAFAALHRHHGSHGRQISYDPEATCRTVSATTG